jgi:hypothetical protein
MVPSVSGDADGGAGSASDAKSDHDLEGPGGGTAVDDEVLTEVEGPVEDFRLSPRTVAVVAACFAIACLAALVVVADIKGASALATVALALAILAFALQILVFIAQTNASSQATLRSEELNAATGRLLAEMTTTARHTREMVGQQFAALLRAFMDVVPKLTASKEDPAELVRLFQDAIRSEAGRLVAPPDKRSAPAASGTEGTQAAAPPPGGSPRRPATVRRLPARQPVAQQAATRRAAIADMRSFPEEEGGTLAVAQLGTLSDDAIARLRELAEDLIDSTMGGTFVGLQPDDENVARELNEAGFTDLFMRRTGSDEVAERWERLSDTGRQAARILTARGEIPRWAEPVVNRGLATQG